MCHRHANTVGERVRERCDSCDKLDRARAAKQTAESEEGKTCNRRDTVKLTVSFFSPSLPLTSLLQPGLSFALYLAEHHYHHLGTLQSQSSSCRVVTRPAAAVVVVGSFVSGPPVADTVLLCVWHFWIDTGRQGSLGDQI